MYTRIRMCKTLLSCCWYLIQTKKTQLMLLSFRSTRKYHSICVENIEKYRKN